MLRRDAQVLDLVGLDHDVFALAILVTLDDVVFLDGAFVAFAGDLLVPDTLAGRSAKLMEANLAFRFGGGEETHTKGNERNLYLTCPEGSRHGHLSKLRITRRFAKWAAAKTGHNDLALWVAASSSGHSGLRGIPVPSIPSETSDNRK